MRESKSTPNGYRINDAAREVLFLVSQGNSVDLAINWTCALRKFGPMKRAAVARAVTK